MSDCKSVGSDKPTTQWDLCIPSGYVFLVGCNLGDMIVAYVFEVVSNVP